MTIHLKNKNNPETHLILEHAVFAHSLHGDNVGFQL